MHVQMGDTFSTFFAVVDDDSKPFLQPFLFGHLSGGEEQMAQ
jgi:hypothetical protein